MADGAPPSVSVTAGTRLMRRSPARVESTQALALYLRWSRKYIRLYGSYLGEAQSNVAI